MGDLLKFRPRQVEPAADVDPLELEERFLHARLRGLPPPALTEREQAAVAQWQRNLSGPRKALARGPAKVV
jgi:hypothetical protein